MLVVDDGLDTVNMSIFVINPMILTVRGVYYRQLS